MKSLGIEENKKKKVYNSKILNKYIVKFDYNQ